MEIRKATIYDIRQIYDMLIEMHSQIAIKLSPIKPEKLFLTIKMALEEGIVFVAEKGNRIVGSIAGLISSDWWSEKEFLKDLWFYVFPENRKSSIAIKLVKSFIKFACVFRRHRKKR